MDLEEEEEEEVLDGAVAVERLGGDLRSLWDHPL